MIEFVIKAEPIGREGDCLVVKDEHGRFHYLKSPVSNLSSNININNIHVHGSGDTCDGHGIVGDGNWDCPGCSGCDNPPDFFNHCFETYIKATECRQYLILDKFHDQKHPQPPYINLLVKEVVVSDSNILIDYIKIGDNRYSPSSIINTTILQGQSIEISCRLPDGVFPFNGTVNLSGIAWYGSKKYKDLIK